DRHAQVAHAALAHPLDDLSRAVALLVEVAIHNRIQIAAFQQRAELEQRVRQTLIARQGDFGVVEQDERSVVRAGHLIPRYFFFLSVVCGEAAHNRQKEDACRTCGPQTLPPASLPQVLGGPAVLQTSRRLRSRRFLEGLQPYKPGVAQSSVGAEIGTATLARIRSDKAWTKN